MIIDDIICLTSLECSCVLLATDVVFNLVWFAVDVVIGECTEEHSPCGRAEERYYKVTNGLCTLCVHVCACMCVHACVCMCVCVCVKERE